VSARDPFTNAPYALRARDTGVSHRAKDRDHASGEVRGLKALGLFALALAVAVCGLGHRLANVLNRESPINRASVTRFWLEPRNNTVATIVRISSKTRFTSDSQPLPPSPLPSRRVDTHLTGGAPTRVCRPATFRFLIPFRSPPPDSFSLA
jgi:hypothetical protein